MVGRYPCGLFYFKEILAGHRAGVGGPPPAVPFRMSEADHSLRIGRTLRGGSEEPEHEGRHGGDEAHAQLHHVLGVPTVWCLGRSPFRNELTSASGASCSSWFHVFSEWGWLRFIAELTPACTQRTATVMLAISPKFGE